MDLNYVCTIIKNTIGINVLLRILFKLHNTATVDEMIKYTTIIQIVLDAIYPLIKKIKVKTNSVKTFKSNSDTFLKIETKILNAYNLLPKAKRKKKDYMVSKCKIIKIDLERDWGIKVEYNDTTTIKPSPHINEYPLTVLNIDHMNALNVKANTNIKSHNDFTAVSSTSVAPPESTSATSLSPTKFVQNTSIKINNDTCTNDINNTNIYW